MDKKTKRQINKKVLAFERECLFDMLLESDDQNVKDALEQALLAVKLVHSEEIAEEVEEHRQALIEQEESKKEESEIERLIKEMKYKQDIWKKVRTYDYDYWPRPQERTDYRFDKWITSSTNTIVKKTPIVTIDPIKSVNDWLTKVDQK